MGLVPSGTGKCGSRDYGEDPARGIRGHATPHERAALREEGIETMAIPVPPVLKGPVQ